MKPPIGLRRRVKVTGRHPKGGIGRRCGRVAACGLVWLVAACSGAVDLAVQFSAPAPVVTPLPVRMGIHYDNKFKSWVQRESGEDRKGWRIALGKAQKNLFDTVVPLMFETVQDVPTIPASNDVAVDAILAPELLQVQIALPEETHTDFYEAWIKYRIRLYDPAGDPIAAWDIMGYGKVNKRGFLTSKAKRLNMAIDKALRNVGADLVLGFAARQDVKQWLRRRAEPRRVMCANMTTLEKHAACGKVS